MSLIHRAPLLYFGKTMSMKQPGWGELMMSMHVKSSPRQMRTHKHQILCVSRSRWVNLVLKVCITLSVIYCSCTVRNADGCTVWWSQPCFRDETGGCVCTAVSGDDGHRAARSKQRTDTSVSLQRWAETACSWGEDMLLVEQKKMSGRLQAAGIIRRHQWKSFLLHGEVLQMWPWWIQLLHPESLQPS